EGSRMLRLAGFFPCVLVSAFLSLGSLAAHAASPGSFSLSLPAANATGVSPTPALSWGTASGVTSYRVEMTGDVFGSPNPVPFRNQNVGNVTSWTYNRSEEGRVGRGCGS